MYKDIQFMYNLYACGEKKVYNIFITETLRYIYSI